MEIELDHGINQNSIDRAFSVLPPRIKGVLIRALSSHRDAYADLCEIRLRLYGRSSLVIGGRNVPIHLRLCERDMRYIIDAATAGSIYSQWENLKEGFIPLGYGVRMGVCLSPSFELPTSVAIRLPIGECENGELIYSWYKDALPRGTVIYSPPGVGKTTALRSLARLAGERDSCRIVIVDERREFDPDYFKSATVDIISGLPKAHGIEIAKRTLGAELIIADEIGCDAECDALISVGRGGVSFVVTAHAADIDELISLRSVRPLVERGYFGVAIGLSRIRGRIAARVDKL